MIISFPSELSTNYLTHIMKITRIKVLSSTKYSFIYFEQMRFFRGGIRDWDLKILFNKAQLTSTVQIWLAACHKIGYAHGK